MVTYSQEVFLPTREKLEPMLHQWGDVNLDELLAEPMTHHTIVWHHNESTFYANDWCKIQWVHKGKNAVLNAKGKGVSLKVVDFVLANYGWLCTSDGSQHTWVLFKDGKAWEGYFMNDDILRQTTNAMDIYPRALSVRKSCFCF